MTTPNDNNPPSLSELRDNDDINFLGLLDVVLEARWLIAAIALVTTLLGGIYAFLSQPVYQADSLIQVEQSQGTTSNLLSEMSTLFDVQSSASAEIEILRSRLVVGHAVDNLQLYLSATPNYLPFIGPWLAARATELSDPGFLGFGRYVSGTESIRLGMLDVPHNWRARILPYWSPLKDMNCKMPRVANLPKAKSASPATSMWKANRQDSDQQIGRQAWR